MVKHKQEVEFSKEHVIITTHSGLIFSGYVFYSDYINEIFENRFCDFDEDDGRHLILNCETIFMIDRNTMVVKKKRKKAKK